MLQVLLKIFLIPHPLFDNKYLQHICIKAPKADLIYRGNVTLVNGEADIDIDLSNNMSDGTFQALSKDPHVYLTNKSDWDLVKVNNYDEISTGKFKIISNNQSSNASIDWMVIATRKNVDLNLETEIMPEPEIMPESEIITEPGHCLVPCSEDELAKADIE